MNGKPVIRRFNISNLQNVGRKFPFEIKELVLYAESRFTTILNHLSKADNTKKSWGQKLLHRELVIMPDVLIHN